MLRSWLPQCIDFRVRSKRADECERHALATGSGKRAAVLTNGIERARGHAAPERRSAVGGLRS